MLVPHDGEIELQSTSSEKYMFGYRFTHLQYNVICKSKNRENRGAFEEREQIYYGLKQDKSLPKLLNYFQRTVGDVENILTPLK